MLVRARDEDQKMSKRFGFWQWIGKRIKEMLIARYNDKEFMTALKIVACAVPIPLILALFIDYSYTYLVFPFAFAVGLYFYYKIEIEKVWQ